MAIDPQIKAQLAQTIYVATAASAPDSAGDPTWAAAASRAARVENKRTMNGEELFSDTLIIVENSIGPSDRIWLPGIDQTDNTLARAPKAIYTRVDELGATSHFEVLV